MNRIKKLVTPEEAITLFDMASCMTVYIAADIARAFADAKARCGRQMSVFALYGCIWNAGRIQGIREERRRTSGAGKGARA